MSDRVQTEQCCAQWLIFPRAGSIKRVLWVELVSLICIYMFLFFSCRMSQWQQPTIITLLWLYKSSSQPQRNQPTVDSLFWHSTVQQRLGQRVRPSTDSSRAATEEEATAHDLLAEWIVGAGTSIQMAAVFDWWRWRETGTETWDPGQKCEGELKFKQKRTFCGFT